LMSFSHLAGGGEIHLTALTPPVGTANSGIGSSYSTTVPSG
jgi:hypothetical protein